jgi:hypothetical protein
MKLSNHDISIPRQWRLDGAIVLMPKDHGSFQSDGVAKITAIALKNLPESRAGFEVLS